MERNRKICLEWDRKAGENMNSETVYLKVSQITEVYEPDVFVKDIADVHCQNKTVEAKVKALKVISFHKEKMRKKKYHGKSRRTVSYVGSILDLVKQVEQAVGNVQVNSLGEADFVIKYRPGKGESIAFQWLKTAAVAVIAFCGAAFAIMTFHNDASVTDVFANIYYLVMGTQSNGATILEFSYSLGLAIGILVFFNHFASWKITVDPTPIEVEMRLYEENVNKTLIQNDARKEKRIDVS